MRVEPKKHFLNWQQDLHSNYLGRLLIEDLSTRFEVTVDLVTEMAAYNPFDFFLEPHADTVPFQYDGETMSKIELAPFLRTSAPGPLLQRLVAESHPRPGMRTIDFLVELNRKLEQHIDYLVRLEPGVQTPEETLTLRSGSCRDTAWLFVQLLRHLGYAARFVSGYLIQLTPDVKPLTGPEGPSHDFTDLHAWTEVYLPGAGWVGLDATSGLLAGEGHIPLACTPEPRSAAPIEGAIDECEAEFVHEMTVTRILETPRVTKPYSEAQWQDVCRLGQQVDHDLQTEDVRLTMGGEPTFVALSDMDAPEWNTDALGPTKANYAEALLHRLARCFAEGGAKHFGQGKWYPGESLPRWAYHCFFLRDGTPLWKDNSLVADATGKHGQAEAQRFINALSRRLEVRTQDIQPGYEDALYYMWKERRLPENLDPLDNRLDNKEDRARLTKVFSQGLSHVVGYALPLEPIHTNSGVRFISGPMFLRAEQLFLMPGDSPMGYRLPLDSLPWAASGDHPFLDPADPFLPERGGDPRLQRRGSEQAGAAGQAGHGDLRPPLHPRGERLNLHPYTQEPTDPPAPYTSAAHIIRTVLCVEARQGSLHVFLPPVGTLEAYQALVTALEDVAAELQMPIRMEGYPPPRDPRLNQFSITPDPGVIEVNIQPSHSFDELRRNTEILYEEARQCGLGTEKFMMDGRHCGTGGGNHITLGGLSANESPMLRRPDVLRSLIGYFHDHPSLSYLFAGLFIGPSSQAPRVDEARHEYLHELELAFAQFPPPGYTTQPWLVDRLLRHLLTDMTGNTHRSEFCIDKLYSPDGPTGRLGLVELRVFEMPPHARMSVVQQLLIRALTARFWKQPYEPKLPRFGTSLHDRFMLPYYVTQDFYDVLDDLTAFGYAMPRAWFDPHIEFRFPHIGEVVHADVRLSLRTALEPWHVLGEEPSGGGTARYVDSSVERLELRVQNAIDRRHVICCNGYQVPLAPTGTHGEYVAGIRFRAWQPPSCLHPTIGVHTPLRLDVVDTWTGRSVGGGSYHVSHPGGRSFDTLPVNAAEAETRRAARFEGLGHTPGPVEVRDYKADKEYPLTLDLRRARY